MPTRALVCLTLLLAPNLSHADPPAKPRVNAHGFPLPEGALRRLGDLHSAQPGTITALALSPDDKLVATAGRRVYLWNADTGRIIRTLDAPHGVRVLAFSRDGQWLAAALGEGKLAVWSVRTGKVRWSISARPPKLDATITALRFLRDDRVLAAAYSAADYSDACVELRYAGDGKLARTWTPDTLADFGAPTRASRWPCHRREGTWHGSHATAHCARRSAWWPSVTPRAADSFAR